MFQDLIDDLKYELTGNFERLIVSLMRTPPQHDAKEIHDALKVRSALNTLSQPPTATAHWFPFCTFILDGLL